MSGKKEIKNDIGAKNVAFELQVLAPKKSRTLQTLSKSDSRHQPLKSV